MPSLFRATIGLKQHQWEWHRTNPGQLSRLAQGAVDRHLSIEALPESAIDRASDDAVQSFWDRYDLMGKYAICNDHIIRHLATEDQMAGDACVLGVSINQLLDRLDDLYSIECEAALLRELIRN